MYTHTMQNLPNYTVLNMQYILYRLSDTVHLISMRSVKILKDCLTIICQCFGSGIHKDPHFLPLRIPRIKKNSTLHCQEENNARFEDRCTLYSNFIFNFDFMDFICINPLSLFALHFIFDARFLAVVK